jgi:hypothetical protein
MSRPGTFVKGVKKPNQGKRGPNKTTVQAREAIAKLVDGNAERLQAWLDEIAADEKQGPAVAFKLLMDVMEYHVPKLARTEHVGDGGGPVVLQLTNQDLTL